MPILLVPQTAAATWRVFCALWSAREFHLVLRRTLFTSSGVSIFISLFFLARFFYLSATSPAGGGTTVCFFCFFLFLFHFRFVFFDIVFCLFPIGSLFHKMCMLACRIQYYDMTAHCPLLRLLHTRCAAT